MNPTHICATALALLALGGCVTEPSTANGHSVRAIMASQVLPPQPKTDAGMDAVAAVAAQASYQRSYTTPTSQSDRAAFGGK